MAAKVAKFCTLLRSACSLPRMPRIDIEELVRCLDRGGGGKVGLGETLNLAIEGAREVRGGSRRGRADGEAAGRRRHGTRSRKRNRTRSTVGKRELDLHGRAIERIGAAEVD